MKCGYRDCDDVKEKLMEIVNGDSMLVVPVLEPKKYWFIAFSKLYIYTGIL